MGYHTRVKGHFTIEPPLTWPEFKTSMFHPDSDDPYGADLRLHIVEQEIQTEHGVSIIRTADRLEMLQIDEYRAYHLVEQVQKAVDSFPGHTWSGGLECEGEESGDIWRVQIIDGIADKIEPQIVWPDEPTESEKRVRALHPQVTGDDGSVYCDLCSNHGDIHWPCATLAALEGP